MNEIFRVTKVLTVNPYNIIKVIEEKLRWNVTRLEQLKPNDSYSDSFDSINFYNQARGRVEMLEEILEEMQEALDE